MAPEDVQTQQPTQDCLWSRLNEFGQKAIEGYFEEFQVTDPDIKAAILPDVTDLIYDRNMAVVALEKAASEVDEYKCRQQVDEITELEQQIKKIIGDKLNELNQ